MFVQLHVMERKALIWSQNVLERMLPRDCIVLLRDFNIEVLGRSSLPDLNPSGALALSFCAVHRGHHIQTWCISQDYLLQVILRGMA